MGFRRGGAGVEVTGCGTRIFAYATHTTAAALRKVLQTTVHRVPVTHVIMQGASPHQLHAMEEASGKSSRTAADRLSGVRDGRMWSTYIIRSVRFFLLSIPSLLGVTR